MIINYSSTYFLTSSTNGQCASVKQDGMEIALTGYSNSGKSTLINCLTHNKKLSRFSKYPGRTNMINFFTVNSYLRLVDLPGYGYSTVYTNKKNNYNLIFNYIQTRSCLKGILLLIDIRRLLRVEDIKLLQYLQIKYINIMILLTKCDKLNFSFQKKQMNIIKQQMVIFGKKIPIVLFSSLKNIGVLYVLKIIDIWFNKYI
ncbi:ribosome biogenesis GTP-binding protein YihA/YsxC [Buchnera aphidicola (Takecallis taiwana)]|uniref:ribosome biogenesis GTP-binding protein YihA/YsxC n=1 Tax=Buchnera aphidicola TaxID=9 RepID=UPI0031B7316D